MSGSDIPLARANLERALEIPRVPELARKYIRSALALMTRRSADFRVEHDVPPMTWAKREQARRLRSKGWSMRRIAEHLRTNSGRVSEACNGK